MKLFSLTNFYAYGTYVCGNSEYLTRCRHCWQCKTQMYVALLSMLKTCLFLKSGLLCNIKFFSTKIPHAKCYKFYSVAASLAGTSNYSDMYVCTSLRPVIRTLFCLPTLTSSATYTQILLCINNPLGYSTNAL